MKRVAIYIRKASKTDINELRALSGKLEQYACEHSGTVVGEYIDNGYSGCKFRRPELKRLLKDCKKGKIDDVLILTRSHLARKLEVDLKICKKFKKFGIALTSLDTRSVDYTIENMLSYMTKKLKGCV